MSTLTQKELICITEEEQTSQALAIHMAALVTIINTEISLDLFQGKVTVYLEYDVFIVIFMFSPPLIDY